MEETGKSDITIDLQNKNAVTEPDMSPDFLFKKVQACKDDLEQANLDAAKKEQQQAQLLNFSKDTNVRIKEDYEMLEKRMNQTSSASETLVADFKNQLHEI